MIWTETRPVKEGWYWHKQFNGQRHLRPEIVYIMSIGTHDRFLVEVGDRQWDLALVSKEYMWAGPIEEPNESD